MRCTEVFYQFLCSEWFLIGPSRLVPLSSCWSASFSSFLCAELGPVRRGFHHIAFPLGQQFHGAPQMLRSPSVSLTPETVRSLSPGLLVLRRHLSSVELSSFCSSALSLSVALHSFSSFLCALSQDGLSHVDCRSGEDGGEGPRGRQRTTQLVSEPWAVLFLFFYPPVV